VDPNGDRGSAKFSGEDVTYLTARAISLLDELRKIITQMTDKPWEGEREPRGN
jgi:hypothetical protein